MYYEINVSLNGYHFFATHKRSITTDTDLKKALDIFTKKFPKEEGYLISASFNQEIGKHVDIDEVLNSK